MTKNIFTIILYIVLLLGYKSLWEIMWHIRWVEYINVKLSIGEVFFRYIFVFSKQTKRHICTLGCADNIICIGRCSQLARNKSSRRRLSWPTRYLWSISTEISSTSYYLSLLQSGIILRLCRTRTATWNTFPRIEWSPFLCWKIGNWYAPPRNEFREDSLWILIA